MKVLDLHPKAATYARSKTVAGGALTISTLFIAFILVILRARVDFTKRVEDVQIDRISRDDKVPVSLEIVFLDVNRCDGLYQVEVIDALGRKLEDADARWEMFQKFSRECRVKGTMKVPPGRGTFRIYPENLSPEFVHANHRVVEMTVGSKLSGVSKEARMLTTTDVRISRSGAWSYYLALVPTTSNGVDGYQIAATRTFVEMPPNMAARGSLYFHYEASPVRMHMDAYWSFTAFAHFFARVAGIISGLFAFVGLAKEVFFAAAPKSVTKAKKPELAM